MAKRRPIRDKLLLGGLLVGVTGERVLPRVTTRSVTWKSPKMSPLISRAEPSD